MHTIFPLVSRLAAMDQAIHKLNVGHYTLDVKVSQLLDRVVRLESKALDVEDSVQDVSAFCKDNRKEIGRLEGAWFFTSAALSVCVLSTLT